MEKLVGWFLHVQLHAYTLLGPSRYAVWLRMAKTQKHTKTWALHGTTWHYMALHGTTNRQDLPRLLPVTGRPLNSALPLPLTSALEVTQRLNALQKFKACNGKDNKLPKSEVC